MVLSQHIFSYSNPDFTDSVEDMEEREETDDESIISSSSSRLSKGDDQEDDWYDWRKYLPGFVCLFCPATYANAGTGMILFWAFGGERSIRISAILITFLLFVFTPCTYILNRETTKQIIVLENWLKGVQYIFMGASEAQSEVERLERVRQNAQ